MAEDSKVARAMLEKGLNAMGIPHQMHVTGKDAWERIQQLAQEAEAEGKPISEKIALVLTDLEMPEMDGFTLTRKIKTDERLKRSRSLFTLPFPAAPTKIMCVGKGRRLRRQI